MSARFLLAVMVMVLAVAGIAAASEDVDPVRYHRHRHPGHHHFPTPAPPSPPAPVVPTPPPPAPTPEPCGCCDLCRIVPGPFMAVPGGGSSSAAPIPPETVPPAPVVVNCVTALAGLSPCVTFLTGRAGPAPTPQCACCNGLSAFLSSARAAGGQQTLRCLCPILHGDVNVALPKPVDPIRMMILPVACGLLLPPETFSTCFGQHMPTVANLTWATVLH